MSNFLQDFGLGVGKRKVGAFEQQRFVDKLR